MKICCHYGGVSTYCRNGGDIHLQEFRRVGRTVVLFRQVRLELGWPGRYAEMIHECGAAHASQGDTCLELGTHCGLRCYRSKVLIEVATLDV
jgi:putative hemolysin